MESGIVVPCRRSGVSALRIVRGWLIVFAVFLFATEAAAQSAENCGPLAAFAGDYRSATESQRYMVESAHFTRNIELLQHGNSGSLGGELHFTLRTFPNHHRALMSMANLSLKQKRDMPDDAVYTVECWFERAIRFRPKDGTVRMIHGIYLMKRGQVEKAVMEFEEASKTVENRANLAYNLGLGYFEMKDYQRALSFAHEAYGLGFPLPGLRRKLVAAGKWRDPAPVEKGEVVGASKDQADDSSTISRPEESHDTTTVEQGG